MVPNNFHYVPQMKKKMLLFMWIKQLVGLKYLIFLFHFFIFYEFFM